MQSFMPKEPYKSGEDKESFTPYGVGYIEMPCGLRVESRLTENDPQKLRIGMPVKLKIEQFRTDEHGKGVMSYAFSPIEPEDAR